jgi:hypothetical protein
LGTRPSGSQAPTAALVMACDGCNNRSGGKLGCREVTEHSDTAKQSYQVQSDHHEKRAAVYDV